MEPSLRARVRAGDAAAFGALFDEHARAVYNLGFQLTGGWSAAEEVVSLTFLEAWRLHGRVQCTGGSLRPWLCGVAVNVARNLIRARRRHQAAMSRLPAPPAVSDFADDVADRIDQAEQLRQVRQALAVLRRGERKVIALCVWSGLDYTSAAQVLGIPVGTVRSRLSRARARLRTLVTADRDPACGREQLPGDRQHTVRPEPGEAR
jgi:RNA polymerase sigma factor (sigma-70 family)